MMEFDERLIRLASDLDKPLYAVGGTVRNYLIDGTRSFDVDLAAAVPTDEFLRALKKYGFAVKASYPRTGTVLFSGGGEERYEYTSFRKDTYNAGGSHTPNEVEFTGDITEDALRRDFKCNAVYASVATGEIVDPLGGVSDIKTMVLDTVDKPEKVFASDGLRLMRLARFTGELNFKPTETAIRAARDNADNILDISPERIYDELIKILHSNRKYPFSDVVGHYTGLKILDETRVLDRIMPELTEGRGMAQRADFHKFDVLEHSLRSALYAPESVRLAALLHDVGKPYCLKRDGMYRHHYIDGVRIAENILRRMKADKATVRQVGLLVKTHMVDIDCSLSEKKVRRFIVEYIDRYREIMLVKQADHRASLESESVSPTLVKWAGIYKKMLSDGTPFGLKDLAISAQDLIEMGFCGEEIGKEMKKLFVFAVENPHLNTASSLKNVAASDAADKNSKGKV